MLYLRPDLLFKRMLISHLVVNFNWDETIALSQAPTFQKYWEVSSPLSAIKEWWSRRRWVGSRLGRRCWLLTSFAKWLMSPSMGLYLKMKSWICEFRCLSLQDNYVVLYSYWCRSSQCGTKEAVISSQHVDGSIRCTQCQFGERRQSTDELWRQSERLCTFTERN